MSAVKFERSLQQWAACDPRVMATQSPAAIAIAFADAKADMATLARQRDALAAEVERLRCLLEVSEDTLKVIRGCLRGAEADVEALQAQVKALQSDANSYQSGFDAGRLSAKAHADNWRKQAERDAARLDWVAQQFRTCTVDMGGNHPYAPGHEVRRLRGPTFRHAIDAAMAQQEPSA